MLQCLDMAYSQTLYFVPLSKTLVSSSAGAPHSDPAGEF